MNFDKTDIAFRNLTLFLYPDDSNRQGELLRIFQQYFMVSNGAQLIIDEAIEKGSNLHDYNLAAMLLSKSTILTHHGHPWIDPSFDRTVLEWMKPSYRS